MAIQNNQWQYRGLTVSGSYQRIVSVRWEADAIKTYYTDEGNGTVREEANCNVRVGTYANYNERTGSRLAFVEHNDYHITVDLTSSLDDTSILGAVYTALKVSPQWEYSGSTHIQDV
jgi:hypothetical protein